MTWDELKAEYGSQWEIFPDLAIGVAAARRKALTPGEYARGLLPVLVADDLNDLLAALGKQAPSRKPPPSGSAASRAVGRTPTFLGQAPARPTTPLHGPPPGPRRQARQSESAIGTSSVTGPGATAPATTDPRGGASDVAGGGAESHLP
ncbi:hypothetical protein GCM10009560_62200 [Nonomuraea longicatena]|uniref:Uncharacterized protein n=1 Tax=Nonomuraea longicatena TaxID=83682 RepID=A0ABP4BDJ7_9ACTN